MTGFSLSQTTQNKLPVGHTVVEMAEKLPFQAVEKRAKPFIESVIPVNVERLHKHRENLQAVSLGAAYSEPTCGAACVHGSYT